MSNLQDEETPVLTGGKGPGGITPRTAGAASGQAVATMAHGDEEEESWAKFEATHPSVIDKLFSGKPP
jgi:hypothetical protein